MTSVYDPVARIVICSLLASRIGWKCIQTLMKGGRWKKYGRQEWVLGVSATTNVSNHYRNKYSIFLFKYTLRRYGYS